ncbi:MAG: 3-deoxy-7-phosphoheptulonate synthase [Parachlamydia sp.]|nr:3-deoxy-7-phosphoheptulonate synthase [Parachlamydia sp.]
MNKINLVAIDPLPSPSALREQYPLGIKEAAYIEKTRREIVQILDRDDPRLLLIVGPCSIHDVNAAEEYALKLRQMARDLSDTFLIVMRVYFDKPRTTLGWKGLLGDPHLNGSHAIDDGLRLTRQLLIRMAELEMPTAAEFLDPTSGHYFGDLVSWGCIGARTSESQTHRQLASSLPMPTAFKNSTAGNIEVAINGILAASQPQTYIGMDDHGQIARVRSAGNPCSHLALRGGELKPNFDAVSIANCIDKLENAKLPARVIIDCSHDNSRRKHEQQVAVFQSVVQRIADGEECIRGLILESHLFAGNQTLLADKSKLQYAVSLTDPCLDWETTRSLIEWGYEALQKKQSEAMVEVECEHLLQ